MTCTYTGATVFFDEYGATAKADLHEVAGATIVRWNPLSWKYAQDPDDKSITHVVHIGTKGYHRTDLALSVVPTENVTHVMRGEAVTP